MRYLEPYPKYEKGQMYDPFKLGGVFGGYRGGIGGEFVRPRVMSGKQYLWGKEAGKELGKEFSWLYGGRPLTMDEMQPLMAARGGRDPRMGTIGGMPALGQGPRAGTPAYSAFGPGAGRYTDPGVDYKKPGPFTSAIPGEEDIVEFPYTEVAPTPAAMRDVKALTQLPYDLMDQYKRVAEQGIYGPAGMHQIVSRGILPSMERTKRMTTEALTQARAARQQTVAQGARMLGKQLGGKFASQPGLAMKLMGDQIIAPSLAKEMEMSIDLKVNETNTLNALQGAIGDLLKANQESKAMGLAGVQDVMGFLQNRTGARWWDLTMENKFGWSPERTQAAALTAARYMARLNEEFQTGMVALQAHWQDWMNEQQYEREEYGGGGTPQLGYTTVGG